MADVLPASFRGVPFAVQSSPTQGGRRQAIHDYPGKDGTYPEDMGRRGRRYAIKGFIVSNSFIYGGGDVALQRQLLTAALEAKGSGLLVHPTYGVVTVSVDTWSISDDLDAGTRADIELNFIEFTQQSFLGISADTVAQVLSAATVVDAAATAAFELANVSGVSGAQASTAWSTAVVAGGQDATALTNLASQLTAPAAQTYGRYFAGANAGYTSSAASPYASDTTVTQLVADAATQRADIAAAAATVATDFNTLTSGTAAQTAGDVQALIAALSAACADPADALRILAALAATAPTGVAGVDDLYRRAAVVATAAAASSYQPSSYNDAMTVLGQITALIDNEITIAGDEGDDASYQAFKALRVQSVADLRARGGDLAPLITVDFPASLPALYLAERLYGDAARADELIAEADPYSPLFMPSRFQALSS